MINFSWHRKVFKRIFFIFLLQIWTNRKIEKVFNLLVKVIYCLRKSKNLCALKSFLNNKIHLLVKANCHDCNWTWTKWFWVRVQLQSLKLQTLCLLQAKSFLTFRQLQNVDSLWNVYMTWQEHTVSIKVMFTQYVLSSTTAHCLW